MGAAVYRVHGGIRSGRRTGRQHAAQRFIFVIEGAVKVETPEIKANSGARLCLSARGIDVTVVVLATERSRVAVIEKFLRSGCSGRRRRNRLCRMKTKSPRIRSTTIPLAGEVSSSR
jgi:hypothetical protein